ncbi:hypothetical protein MKK84_13070 [Methylobacterium sp. E-065]|uniref:hypothetical protein n=1 Tax=Methylobacterium sp. E-065 TaxID=2836583 RepID=UPI001FBB86AA|nr:hypothetical protein [Methylobacterium sp. E-065]MCJ2018350.1 hypothetical protein [Methylobacterium sp. E-065]
MPIGRPKRRLPDSLTQHLTDPKIVALRPRTTKRNRPHQGSELAKKIALSAVTLIVVVLAGGHLMHAW